MQLEMAVTGHISSVADDYYVRTLGSHVLMDAVKGSSHQLQELASELGALFLVRHITSRHVIPFRVIVITYYL